MTQLSTGWDGYCKRDDMQPGKWLILFGQTNQGLVPIDAFEFDHRGPFSDTYVSTRATELMQAAMADGPLKRMLIVEDHCNIEERRRVEIVEVDDRYCIKDDRA